MRKLYPLILTALVVTGCTPKPDVGTYPFAQAEAFARLEKADVKGFISARRCGVRLTLDADKNDPVSIKWDIYGGSEDVGSFTVKLVAVDAMSTKSLIEVSADPKGGEIFDGTKQYDAPAMQQPLRSAVQELIDAAMETRPFDPAKIADPHELDSNCTLQRKKAGSQLAATSSGGNAWGFGDPTPIMGRADPTLGQATIRDPDMPQPADNHTHGNRTQFDEYGEAIPPPLKGGS
jgi:hypothetical protein